MLMVNVDFVPMLIGAEGARLLGEDGAGETHRRLSAEEAPRTASAALRAWSAKQQATFTKPKK
jgi:hypothetical protein